MKVTTWSLQMHEPRPQAPRPFPDGVRLDRATGITPEYARFLYALVGGPWTWTDRLGWSRQQWADELAVPGSEFWVLYSDGAPAGYAQLHPTVEPNGTHVEIRYFGLCDRVIGRGLGSRLLEHTIAAAWTLPARTPLPGLPGLPAHTERPEHIEHSERPDHTARAALPGHTVLPGVARVWVHTCSLDGPAALANYQGRGLVIYHTEETDENVPDQPLGSWISTGGPTPGSTVDAAVGAVGAEGPA
ncbi:GNAT family N-acetyltransferase [Actinoplanes sp. NPDC051851]|uniref:GNAT family N-acetyltransferase n=1 Tax=Actinoplanes sp. NPDC051851 TaxID=3154753 RepID=UPI003427CF4B